MGDSGGHVQAAFSLAPLASTVPPLNELDPNSSTSLLDNVHRSQQFLGFLGFILVVLVYLVSKIFGFDILNKARQVWYRVGKYRGYRKVQEEGFILGERRRSDSIDVFEDLVNDASDDED